MKLAINLYILIKCFFYNTTSNIKNFFSLFIPYFLLVLLLIFYTLLTLYFSSPHLCEDPRPVVSDTNDWIIYELFGGNKWDVHFKIVGASYRVTARDFNNGEDNLLFRFLNTNNVPGDTKRVDHSRLSSDIINAVKDHNQEIILCNFHASAPVIKDNVIKSVFIISLSGSMFFKNYISNIKLIYTKVIIKHYLLLKCFFINTISYMKYYFYSTTQLKKFIVFLLTLIFICLSFLVIYNNMNARVCEQCSFYEQDNLFWKIEQTATNAWDVLFRNVNIQYQVTSSDRIGDIQNQDFRLRQIDRNVSAGQDNIVDHIRVGNNIGDVVMAHFNSIQCGEFHPNSPNFINPNAHGKGINSVINSPLDQFLIREYVTVFFAIFNNFKFSFTNIGFYLTIAAFSGSALNLVATNFNRIISNLWSVSQESIYATIHGIVINQINAIKGQIYFPFIYVLFIFILVSNLMGMIPYSFSSTSHFILTFFISFTVVIGSTFLGFQSHLFKFFSILVPSGCPLPLLPLLVLIEFISYLARNVSLGLRLAANILSGHMLLNILSGFVYNIMKSGFIYFFISLIPLTFIMAFSALEIGISFIQAQVFSVLSSSYIKDGLELH